MKKLIFIALIFIAFKGVSQSTISIDRSKIYECCQHLDEEYGEAWTLMVWVRTERKARFIIKRYLKLDIANNYFESNGEYYIELIDPSDLQERINNKPMIPKRARVITVDFLVLDNGQAITDDNGNKIIVL